MYFLIEDDELFKKHNTIWHNVSANIKQNERDLVYNKQFFKTKIKSHGYKVTYFYDKKLLNSTLIILL